MYCHEGTTASEIASSNTVYVASVLELGLLSHCSGKKSPPIYAGAPTSQRLME